MTVVVQRPSNLFDQFQRDVEQLFVQKNTEHSWSPAVDIREYKDRFVLRADIPGVPLSDIDISIEKNLLTIAGQRDTATVDAEGQAHRTERSYGKFSRQFRLPESVNVEAVAATGDCGVIEVTVPKAEKVRPRRIEVSAV